jgi:TctA family transporter
MGLGISEILLRPSAVSEAIRGKLSSLLPSCRNGADRWARSGAGLELGSLGLIPGIGAIVAFMAYIAEKRLSKSPELGQGAIDIAAPVGEQCVRQCGDDPVSTLGIPSC